MLQTDASIKGLGACLLQEEKPVHFASKALTEAQKGYEATETELLAVAWAMEKFHHFLYASHFILETDQKPLEAILSKSLNQATPKLQRILIRISAYHFTVRYIPGVTNQLAECLSRLSCQKDTIKLPKLHIHRITSQLNARSDSLNDIRIAPREDDEHTIMHGWPSTIREVPSEIQPYLTFSEELTVEDCLVLEGTCIVIPHKKHQATLQLMHEVHLGLGKCKLRAKDTVYWLGLNDQLEKLILKCELCLKYSHSKYKQKPSTFLGQEIPVQSWTKLVTDIFNFESSSHLLVADYTSRFLVVHKLSSMTGQHIANQCKLIFSECGWPDTLISDNGPCYTSQTFNSVIKLYNVNHITSSPYYPQSNGLAESMSRLWRVCSTKLKKVAKILQVPHDLSQYPTYR